MSDLQVICNPFAHLDHEGLPAGALPFEPSHHGGARRWVGATIDTAKTRIIQPAAGSSAAAVLRGRKINYAPPPAQRTVFAHDLSPQTVPDSAYYRQAIRCGDLIAADTATASAVGVEFIGADKGLSAARAAAIESFALANGRAPDTSLWPDALRPKAPASAGSRS